MKTESFVLQGMPSCCIDLDRKHQLIGIIDGMLWSSFVPGDECDDLYDAIEWLENDAKDEMAICRLPGIPYEILLTGGAVWVEATTDAFAMCEIITSCEEIVVELEKWAKEDYAKKQRNALPEGE